MRIFDVCFSHHGRGSDYGHHFVAVAPSVEQAIELATIELTTKRDDGLNGPLDVVSTNEILVGPRGGIIHSYDTYK